MIDILVFLLVIPCAVLVGTFAEYFVHRAMHWGLLYPKGHIWHHESGEARTFRHDFVDYGMGAALVCWLGFLISVPVGLGWLVGAVLYAALASYAHQVQHADPDLVFWMKRPVHTLHHAVDMRDANFGILVDWWDRLFGSYRAIEWPRGRRFRDTRPRDYVAIPWT